MDKPHGRSGHWVDLGRMPYRLCHELQNRILDEVALGLRPSTLLFVEHLPVLTLGANFHAENLRLPRADYGGLGIDVVETDRGGDVTFHGPGQLVAYPVFELKPYNSDLHQWLRGLEEAVIRTVGQLGLSARRFPPHTGVWMGDRKVCAIGIKVRRWVSKHGIALNCSNDLSPFQSIVPCGIEGYEVTSLSREAGRSVSVEDVKPVFRNALENVFEIRLDEKSRSEWESALQT